MNEQELVMASLADEIAKAEEGMEKPKEIIMAMCDEDGVVKNTFVVYEGQWDLGGIKIGDYQVRIGDIFNYAEKKFYHADGTPCLTEEEAKKLGEKDVTKVEEL